MRRLFSMIVIAGIGIVGWKTGIVESILSDFVDSQPSNHSTIAPEPQSAPTSWTRETVPDEPARLLSDDRDRRRLLRRVRERRWQRRAR